MLKGKHFGTSIHHREDIGQALAEALYGEGNVPCLHVLCNACSGFKVIELLAKIEGHLEAIGKHLEPR